MATRLLSLGKSEAVPQPGADPEGGRIEKAETRLTFDQAVTLGAGTCTENHRHDGRHHLSMVQGKEVNTGRVLAMATSPSNSSGFGTRGKSRR